MIVDVKENTIHIGNKNNNSKTYINDINFTNKTLNKTDFFDKIGKGATFENASISNSRIIGTDFEGSNFEFCTFKNVEFIDTNLSYSNFEGATFIKCSFKNTSTKGVILKETKFINTKGIIPISLKLACQTFIKKIKKSKKVLSK